MRLEFHTILRLFRCHALHCITCHYGLSVALEEWWKSSPVTQTHNALHLIHNSVHVKDSSVYIWLSQLYRGPVTLNQFESMPDTTESPITTRLELCISLSHTIRRGRVCPGQHLSARHPFYYDITGHFPIRLSDRHLHLHVTTRKPTSFVMDFVYVFANPVHQTTLLGLMYLLCRCIVCFQSMLQLIVLWVCGS